MEAKSVIPLILLLIFSAGCIDSIVNPSLPNETGKTSLQNCLDACGSSNFPVCSTGNVTYKNRCILDCNGASLSYSGECKSAPPIAAQNWCNDSDSGSDVMVKGTTTSSQGNGIDFCLSNSSVEEYSCQSSAIKKEAKDCASGYECIQGACSQIKVACIDSDGGANLSAVGTVAVNGNNYTDSCSSTFLVKEYFCSKNTVDNLIMQCPEGQRCGFGKCVNIIYTCNDSDNGKDAYDKSAVTVFSDAGQLNSFVDICNNDSSVKEYFCSGSSQNYSIINCPSDYACSNGACREADCFDSDGGISIYTIGRVTKGSSTYYDKCVGSGGGIEYFCDGKDIEHSGFTCPSNTTCKSGACVR
ncbi:MAG: hypothetical protein NTY68_02455 [Candidatus Micrarchaeota archaeon]|nr:hypothetical protein [Candidatus Micrarchaeota archaeon]